MTKEEPAVGWSARELADLAKFYPGIRSRYRVCSWCRRYIDLRNHRRHVKACARRRRSG